MQVWQHEKVPTSGVAARRKYRYWCSRDGDGGIAPALQDRVLLALRIVACLANHLTTGRLARSEFNAVVVHGIDCVRCNEIAFYFSLQ